MIGYVIKINGDFLHQDSQFFGHGDRPTIYNTHKQAEIAVAKMRKQLAQPKYPMQIYKATFEKVE